MGKIMVVGALGFIGYELSLLLMEEDVEVIAVDSSNLDDVLELKLDEVGRNSLFHFQTDLNDHHHNIKAVVYCCGEENGDNHLDTYEYFTKCLSFCEEREVKLVLVSSHKVFGSVKGKITEDTPVLPDNEYGVKKVEQEKILIQNSKENSFMIIRIPQLYGPWQPANQWIHQQLSKDYTNIYGDHLCKDLLFIRDAVQGIIMCLEKEFTNEIIHLGSGMMKQAYKAARLIGGLDSKKRCEDFQLIKIEKAEQRLEYSPKTSIKHGIQEQKDQLYKINQMKDLFN